MAQMVRVSGKLWKLDLETGLKKDVLWTGMKTMSGGNSGRKSAE